MSLCANQLFNAVVPAPFGGFGICVDDGKLREVVYLPPSVPAMAARDPLSRTVAGQIEAYLADPDFQFDLPLPGVGTAHQRKVWDVICTIPRGQVLSYKEVAARIGSAPRAVGQACGANFFPPVIPCHRVTAASGLGGFARHDGGFHLNVKRWLLAHEGVAGY